MECHSCPSGSVFPRNDWSEWCRDFDWTETNASSFDLCELCPRRVDRRAAEPRVGVDPEDDGSSALLLPTARRWSAGAKLGEQRTSERDRRSTGGNFVRPARRTALPVGEEKEKTRTDLTFGF